MKQWAKDNGWNGEQLAEKLGVSRQTGYNCLAGRVPEWWVLVRIAEEMSTSVDWLLTGREPEGQPPASDWVGLPPWDRSLLKREERTLLQETLDVLRSGDLPGDAGGAALSLTNNIRTFRGFVAMAGRPRSETSGGGDVVGEPSRPASISGDSRGRSRAGRE